MKYVYIFYYYPIFICTDVNIYNIFAKYVSNQNISKFKVTDLNILVSIW